jgi:hypothetical protein
MSGDNLNRNSNAVDNQAPLFGDAAIRTSDSTTNTSNSLVSRDNELIAGIRFLNNSNATTSFPLNDITFTGLGAEGDEEMSFAPTAAQGGDGQAPADGPIQRADMTPEQIHQLRATREIAQNVRDLDSPDFRVRNRAQDFFHSQADGAALPQLLNGLRNNQSSENPSLEFRRRADAAILQVTSRMSTDDLIAMRDPEQRNRAIARSFETPLSEADARALSERLDTVAREEMTRRLTQPTWLRDLRYDSKDGVERIPSQANVDANDRLATPEGRRQANQRLEELGRMDASPHITESERELINEQRAQISAALRPSAIADGRAGSRIALAEVISRENADAPDDQTRAQNVARMENLLLDAYRISPTPNPDQEHGSRRQTMEAMVSLGLDRNPEFMRRFEAQSGQDAVRAVRRQREIADQHREDRGQGAAQNIPRGN